ncbi:hypothetical protein PFZ55_40180 [Streptomyces sp. MS2A]|nr:hypothetical protein [Streptomyces sp. MS2A]
MTTPRGITVRFFLRRTWEFVERACTAFAPLPLAVHVEAARNRAEAPDRPEPRAEPERIGPPIEWIP